MSGSAVWMPTLSRAKSQSYEWRIENFSKQQFRQQELRSYSTVVDGISSSDFMLSFVNILAEITKVSLRLRLTRDGIGSEQRLLSQWLRLSVSVSLLGLCSRIDYSKNICTAWIFGRHKERMCILKQITSRSGDFEFTNPEFVLYHDLFDKDRGLLRDDSLTIVCQVYAITYNVNCVDNWLFSPVEPTVPHHTENTLGKDLKRMLDTEQGSDVMLVASDGKEFPAHTLILSSRSPVFSAMFEHDMKEKQEKRVTIEDLDSKAVKSLLDFMYTDSVPILAQLAPQLLFAANKYQIPTLKTVCEESMTANLTINNATKFLSCADLYDATQLRNAAKRFVVRNLSEIKKTDSWKTLRNQSPHLLDEIIDELAEVMRQLTTPSAT